MASSWWLTKAGSTRHDPRGESRCKMIKNVPWHRYKDQHDADGDIPDEKEVDVENFEVEKKEPMMVIKTRQLAPRAFQIRKEDAEKHGYSRGCASCSSWFRGLGRQPHTTECRARFAEVLKEDAKYRNAERKRVEFENKVKEKDDRKRRKKERGDAELVSAAMDTPVESAKRGREDDGLSVTVAGPEEDERRESASKIQRKDAVKEDDDMNIQAMEINVDEGDENVEEDEFEQESEAQLEINGVAVQAARCEEITFMEGLKVWESASWDECIQRTGKAPVSTRWVDEGSRWDA